MSKRFSFDTLTVMDYPTEQQEMDWLDEVENITYTYDNVKRELNRKLALAKKYGYEEYADELAHLLEMVDAFRKARK